VLLSPYGSVEHMNEETGQAWLQRIIDTWGKVIWLNPSDESYWKYTQTTDAIKDQIGGHMYPLTVEGLENAIKYLSK